MIYRNGVDVSTVIEFGSGLPTGSIAWSVLDESGGVLDQGSVTPAAGAVSTVLVVPSDSNTLVGDALSGYRDLTWSYMIDSGEVINGELRYNLEARAPWGATEDGVRNKLGLEVVDLPNHDISLITAYYDFLGVIGNPDLSGLVVTDAQRRKLANSLEARTALSILPTLQMRTALKESSGTDTFQRHKIDWALLASNLQNEVLDGILIIVPEFDLTAGAGAIFLLATPTADPITGA